MSLAEVERKVIDCIISGVTLWGDICKHINTSPCVVTLACIKLERDLVIKHNHFSYSLFLYSGEML